MSNAYYNTKSELISLFLDGTPNESTYYNRLVTRETDGGRVALIAYGQKKIAEYDPTRSVVTLFDGWKGEATMLTRYVNDVERVISDLGDDASEISVVHSGETPLENLLPHRGPNRGAQYVDAYVSMDGKQSPVEKKAVQTVIDSLRFLSE